MNEEDYKRYVVKIGNGYVENSDVSTMTPSPSFSSFRNWIPDYLVDDKCKITLDTAKANIFVALDEAKAVAEHFGGKVMSFGYKLEEVK